MPLVIYYFAVIMWYLELCVTSSSWRPRLPHSSRSFLMREFWELSSSSNSETAGIGLLLQGVNKKKKITAFFLTNIHNIFAPLISAFFFYYKGFTDWLHIVVLVFFNYGLTCRDIVGSW